MNMVSKVSGHAQLIINALYRHGSRAKRPLLAIDWAYALAEDEGPLFWEVIVEMWSSFDLIPQTISKRCSEQNGATGDWPRACFSTPYNCAMRLMDSGNGGMRTPVQ